MGFRKYMSHPQVVSAMQFLGKDSATEIIRMTTGIREEKGVDGQGNLVPILIVQVYDSEVQAALGDWIIIDPAGVPYPCKPDIFEKKYVYADGQAPPTAEIPQ